MLCCRKLPLPSRIRLLECCVWSVLLYGVETWTVSQISKKRLDAFELWAMRRLMRISWTERMPNERAMTLVGVRRELIQLIQKLKLRYAEHLIRHDSL